MDEIKFLDKQFLTFSPATNLMFEVCMREPVSGPASKTQFIMSQNVCF